MAHASADKSRVWAGVMSEEVGPARGARESTNRAIQIPGNEEPLRRFKESR